MICSVGLASLVLTRNGLLNVRIRHIPLLIYYFPSYSKCEFPKGLFGGLKISISVWSLFLRWITLSMCGNSCSAVHCIHVIN